MLSAVDREILLALLVGGADTPRNLSEICDRHHQSVQKRIAGLQDDDLVIAKGRGVYAISMAGAETARALRRETEIMERLDLDAVES